MNKKNENNPFRRGVGKIQQTKKESEWGKVKFNPVAKAAAIEQATPWSHFKKEITEKHLGDEKGKNNNLKKPNTQDFLKKREENYRRNLIYSKQNEPTQWEDFSDETTNAAKSKNNQVPLKGKFQTMPSNIKNIESVEKNNFDSRLLTFQQNNFLKKVITKYTTKIKGVSFKQAVDDMKLHGVKKKPFRK